MQGNLLAERPRSGTIGTGADATRSEKLLAAAVAALLGAVVIWGVGFSHIPALHNAAHDTRHSLAFPCH